MAVLDPERDAVVIRIVYDGPPHAGKTTSVRSLARSLSRSVETPLEAEGRTLFFDWMEYTGGLFEGHQIRCQIVSVPGQPDFAARRRALLETADVVVFVADTGDQAAVDRSAGHVREMVNILRLQPGPPVGVVVQANKRDLPDAVPREAVTAAFGDDFARTAVTESIADAGVGIRETFVLAVRLALDRIRELMVRGELPRGKPAADSAEDLLAALEGLAPPSARPDTQTDGEPDERSDEPDADEPDADEPDADEPDADDPHDDDDHDVDVELDADELEDRPRVNGHSNGMHASSQRSGAPITVPPNGANGYGANGYATAAPHATTDVSTAAVRAVPTSSPRPRLPDARVPSGAIWPPVEGRMVLHEAATAGLILHRVGDADWIAGMGTGWRVHSSGTATYSQFDEGREALLAWARLHSAHAELLSPARCVVLAEAGGNTWRLWQIVKLTPSLRAWIVDGAKLEAGELFSRLATAAMLLGEAHARCAETRLPATLDSIGRGPGGPRFVALMPTPNAGPPPRLSDITERIVRELSRMLAAELVERRAELAHLIERNEGWRTPWDDLVAAAIARD